jgi:predicted permease
VWLGLLGSILLLLRNKWAVWSFGLSLAGAVISLGYQVALAPPLAGMEGMFNAVMPYVIIAVCLALFLYARAMEKKGVLR